MTNDAARDLSTWLEAHSHSKAWLARQLGVTQPLIGHWLTGRQRPGLDLATDLERVTDGAVVATSWARRRKRSSN